MTLFTSFQSGWVAGLVSVFWNVGALCADMSNIPLVLFDSFLHSSSPPPPFRFADVHFATFSRDLPHYAILLNHVLDRTHQV